MSFLKTIFSKQEKSFANKLEEFGYFRYAPKDKIKLLKDNIDKIFNQFQVLSTIRDDKYRPLELRYYFCDGEDIHEKNGYKDFIDYIKPTLQQLEVFDEVVKAIPLSSNSQIHVDSVYEMVKGLNNELDKKEINENWYLIYGGNDGQLILLTPEQFAFLKNSIKDAKSRPFEIETWRKLVVFSKSEQSNTKSPELKKIDRGSKINHAKFGKGIIKEINEKGVAIIDFDEYGERKIIMAYAKYVIIN